MNADIIRQSLADRLKELGWTPSRLATEAGKPDDRRIIGQYLKGEYNPGAAKLATWVAAAKGELGIIWKSAKAVGDAR